MKKVNFLGSIKILLPFTILMNVSVHARFEARNYNECSPLEVENVTQWFLTKGEVLENELNKKIYPPQDQGSVGWCFSYNARDLVHYRIGLAPSLDVMAADYYTGFIGGLGSLFGENEGGYVYNNLKRVYKKGLCPEGQEDRVATIDNVKKVRCNQRRISIKGHGLPEKKVSISFGNGSNLFSDIDEQLYHGNIVGIAYNAEGLYKIDYKSDGMIASRMATHASSIVGRFFDEEDGKCRYIIRNSWGTKTNYALEGPQKNGYHSITEENLSRSLYNLTYIRD